MKFLSRVNGQWENETSASLPPILNRSCLLELCLKHIYTRPLKALCVKEPLNHFMTLQLPVKTLVADAVHFGVNTALSHYSSSSVQPRPPLRLAVLKLAQLECVRVGSVHINHSSIWSASSWALHMHAPLLHLCTALTWLECPETSSRALEEVITWQRVLSLRICRAESQKHVWNMRKYQVYRNNTCFLIWLDLQ